MIESIVLSVLVLMAKAEEQPQVVNFTVRQLICHQEDEAQRNYFIDELNEEVRIPPTVCLDALEHLLNTIKCKNDPVITLIMTPVQGILKITSLQTPAGVRTICVPDTGVEKHLLALKQKEMPLPPSLNGLYDVAHCELFTRDQLVRSTFVVKNKEESPYFDVSPEFCLERARALSKSPEDVAPTP